MRPRYDHIDLRVCSLAEARPFYEALLPAVHRDDLAKQMKPAQIADAQKRAKEWKRKTP
jgi:hypothetical protein